MAGLRLERSVTVERMMSVITSVVILTHVPWSPEQCVLLDPAVTWDHVHSSPGQWCAGQPGASVTWRSTVMESATSVQEMCSRAQVQSVMLELVTVTRDTVALIINSVNYSGALMLEWLRRNVSTSTQEETIWWEDQC